MCETLKNKEMLGLYELAYIKYRNIKAASLKSCLVCVSQVN